jgi:hypothetical protein
MEFLLGRRRLRQEPHELMHQPNKTGNYAKVEFLNDLDRVITLYSVVGDYQRSG